MRRLSILPTLPSVRSLFLVGAVALSLAAPNAASAQSLRLFSTGSHVTIWQEANDGQQTDDIYIRYAIGGIENQYYMFTATPGSVTGGQYDFFNVDPGTAVDFLLISHQTDAAFYSDAPTMNVDGRAHFDYFDNENGTYTVHANDDFGRDVRTDYDHVTFAVGSDISDVSPAPEPASLVLLLTGLPLVLGVRRVRRGR